jgi:urease accessory protein
MKPAKSLPVAILVGFLLLLPGVASAHPLAQHIGGLLAGMVHPLTGWDHLAALLALGVWTGQMHRDSFWKLSGAFLVALVAGCMLGMGSGIPVQGGIIASLAAVGLLVALAARPPLPWGLAAVVFFGAIHGLAHGAGMPDSTASLSFITGLSITSITLQVLVAIITRQSGHVSSLLLRLSGGLLAAGCVALAVF